MTVGRIPSVEGGIQPTLLTTKGDIIVATGNATLVRQGVGADGTFLTANSAQADGVEWGGAWTTYTPSVSGITKGNGTEIARFQRIGKTVFFKYRFTLGSTSAITGNINVALPSTSADKCYIVNGQFEDTGTTNFPIIPVTNTTTVDCFVSNASGTYTNGGFASATVPFTWVNTDAINLAGQYEEA
jgi:hypothetical protein